MTLRLRLETITEILATTQARVERCEQETAAALRETARVLGHGR